MARALSAIGAAAVAHLGGDSTGVRSHLEEVTGRLPGGWLGTVHWLRSVAHRRDGDLAAARRELDAAPIFAVEGYRLELETAGLRTAWLEGEVDETHAGWTAHCDQYEPLRDSYTAREVVLELARIEAWLGRAGAAGDLLATCQGFTSMETPLARILACMAETAVAVAEGDEATTAALVSDEVTAALGGPEAWSGVTVPRSHSPTCSSPPRVRPAHANRSARRIAPVSSWRSRWRRRVPATWLRSSR